MRVLWTLGVLTLSSVTFWIFMFRERLFSFLCIGGTAKCMTLLPLENFFFFCFNLKSDLKLAKHHIIHLWEAKQKHRGEQMHFVLISPTIYSSNLLQCWKECVPEHLSESLFFCLLLGQWVPLTWHFWDLQREGDKLALTHSETKKAGLLFISNLGFVPTW